MAPLPESRPYLEAVESLIVSTRASNCLERLVVGMTGGAA